ncbi:hypothetical protein XM75_u0066 [Vibrio vulnificus]|uniref:Uncharacterized protein n=1 Tax=Vibrio vulnificus TaxID=672 RepID=A0AAI9EKR9_VIBVL|nr:hypothetical protein [Vibrio vulnificus]OQK43785.1 hypothetical protein XM75_u0066 [Vibrio vulnificus]CDM12440.1 hypothetical protein [Vibrio vulnificus]
MAKQPEKLPLKSLSNFISPFLINNRPALCSVGEDGRALVYQSSNQKTNYELIEALPVGTGITLDVLSSGVCATMTDDEIRYKAELKKEFEEKMERQRKEDEQRRLRKEKEAADFNASLDIPFQWEPDIKTVMSGLSESSWGNGSNRRTVFHVRVLDTFKDGRFAREKGDFLCGKDTSKHQGYTDPKEGDKNIYKVTCQRCIDAAARFNKQKVVEQQ